ncbi:MAG: hypothetical protein ACI81W_003953, partial [Saprospiraceae bacterium]
WEVEGLSYPDLIEELINYSIKRHEAQLQLKMEF